MTVYNMNVSYSGFEHSVFGPFLESVVFFVFLFSRTLKLKYAVICSRTPNPFPKVRMFTQSYMSIIFVPLSFITQETLISCLIYQCIIEEFILLCVSM